jgi:hypothetical protein
MQGKPHGHEGETSHNSFRKVVPRYSRFCRSLYGFKIFWDGIWTFSHFGFVHVSTLDLMMVDKSSIAEAPPIDGQTD